MAWPSPSTTGWSSSARMSAAARLVMGPPRDGCAGTNSSRRLPVRSAPMSGPVPFRFAVNVRYLEVDQQGVVFNMWYLAYFDDAMTAFLAEGGLPYVEMLAAWFDVQLVHTELDWTGSLRWGEPAEVRVTLTGLGRTSFTLRFTVHTG